MNKKELETIVGNYIKDNLRIGIFCDPDGDGHIKLNISLYLGGEEISKESESIFIGW